MSNAPVPYGGAHWVDHLARHAYSNPRGIALRYEGASIDWEQLHDRVRRLAAVLSARGVRHGDRVAILMMNRPEFVETVIAANTIGAIAVPINFRLVRDEVAYVLGDSGASIIVTDAALAPLAQAAGASLDDPVPVLAAGVDAGGATDIEPYGAVLGEVDAEPPVVDINERDIALIMYTSGTTGRPKGAMLSHLNLLMQALTAIRTSRLVHEDGVGLINVPLFHIAGIGSMPPAFLLGTTTVIMPTAPFTAESTLEIVESEQVTGLFLVPAQWQVLCAHPDATRRTRSLRTISWGAAPATQLLLEQMAQTFPHAEIVSVFGQTEMSPVTTALPSEDAVRKIGSVGKPIPTVAVRIVDDDMNDVASGEVGEIVYRGPTLMAGYWNKPQATAEALDGGWFHSGDLVRQDEEGYIYVVDRKKDMIISGGENIYSAEVENALSRHPAIADVAVIGAAHEQWGETPVAVIVATDPSSPPILEEVAEWLRDRLASYKKPTVLVVLDELPRNAAGKILKHELRAQYGEPTRGSSVALGVCAKNSHEPR
jgi:fatty-acyl-CoA synthase